MAYLERLFRATEEQNRRAILSLLPERRGASLLDLGTRDGTFTARMAERVGAGRVAGVELIDAHAHAARRRGIDARTADLDQGLPFEDGEFDLVSANQLIEHVRRTDVLVREIRRVLAPGGLACISTNNLASWHNVVSLALGWQPLPAHVSDEILLGNPIDPYRGTRYDAPGQTHRRLFTGLALRELAEHHGLRVIAVRGVGYYPLPPRPARVAARVDGRHAAFLVLAASSGVVPGTPG